MSSFEYSKDLSCKLFNHFIVVSKPIKNLSLLSKMEKDDSSRSKRTYKEDVNRLEQLKLKFLILRMWFTCGETPPNSIRFTLYGVLMMLIAGFRAGHEFFKCFQQLPNYSMKSIALFSSSIILLFPSFWVLYISFCCWRRIRGYDWWMIPQIF